ncbi:hypothetical protein [Methylocapsa aurea]|uniref:hypothetical protein n=1 Tax=Methylocapsa aurea TaxID=663610 RepID=UPI00056615CB|nr:hypothetical protein [Methylocapsa aurea]
MIRAIVALLVVLAASAARASPMDTVFAALAAEEAEPIERVRFFIERGGVADIYYIDRARPGRFRMLKNPGQGGLELIVVEGVQWLRTAAGWQKSPAPQTAGLIPSMAEMFREGLTDAIEQPGPDGGSSIEGGMAWTNGASCQGRLLLRISAAGLPSLLRFEGACGGKATRFRQAFSYEGPLTITPPE